METMRAHLIMAGLFTASLGGLLPGRRAAVDSASAIADDTMVVSYMADSIRVIQRLNPYTDVVAVNVYLLGGSRQLTPATQGIESMLLAASRYGSRSFPDTALRAAWGMTGSAAVSDITNDWTMLGFRGTREQFDRSWDIIAERLTAPALKPDAVDLARERLISGLRRRRVTPDGEIAAVADSIVFAGHPYALSPYGTETSLASLDSAKLTGYLRAQMTRSRMLIVVAGGATKPMIEAAIRRTFARQPVGSYVWTPPPPLAKSAGSITLIPKVSTTNYVVGVYDGPPETHEDYPAFRTATSFLSQLMTQAVREKRGLSYAASASVDARAVVTGMLYVSTSSPDTVMRLIMRQVATLQDPDSLPAGMSFTTDKNSLENLFRRSTSDAQVDALAHAQLLQGDFRLADNLPRRMRTVSSSSVRQAARKYMQNLRFVYAGDTARVKRRSFAKF